MSVGDETQAGTVCAMTNKRPKWTVESQSYVLNFHGRVTRVSDGDMVVKFPHIFSLILYHNGDCLLVCHKFQVQRMKDCKCQKTISKSLSTVFFRDYVTYKDIIDLIHGEPHYPVGLVF